METDGGGDQTDSRFFSGSSGGASSDVSAAGLSFNFVYKMDHEKRGFFIIINNREFETKTGMGPRSGTDVDAANLFQQFKKLGFDVRLFNNQTCRQMHDIMKDVGKFDHSNFDCFGCAILSHGDEGVVYGTDGIIEINTLISPVKGDACTSLIGKPKIFFIQACRGDQLDHGVDTADAATEEKLRKQRIPVEADFLYAYSTTPGYFSWRNSSKGSWFIQALCKVLEEHGHKHEIMFLMTMVNRLVAYEFESNSSKEFMNAKKQIPSIVSQLTKQLYIAPKKSK